MSLEFSVVGLRPLALEDLGSECRDLGVPQHQDFRHKLQDRRREDTGVCSQNLGAKAQLQCEVKVGLGILLSASTLRAFRV